MVRTNLVRRRVGRMLAGDNAGMFVRVERDSSGAGFHISLSERHPDDGPSRGGTSGRTAQSKLVSGSSKSSRAWNGCNGKAKHLVRRRPAERSLPLSRGPFRER